MFGRSAPDDAAIIGGWRKRGAAILALCTAFSAQAEMTKDVNVSADIVAGCLVTTSSLGGTWGLMSFGTYTGVDTGVVNTSLTSSAGTGIILDCTPGMTASLSADNGTHAVSGARYMAGPSGSTLAYTLYANGSSTAWTSQSVNLSFPVGTPHMVVPVTGRITLPGNLPAGAYTDTVQVTLSW